MASMNELIEKHTEYCIGMLEELALFQYLSGNGSIQSNTMLTNYYLRALMKIGSSQQNENLNELKKWYQGSSDPNDVIDPFLLEGLIMLGLEDDSEYVNVKLDELVKDRYFEGRFELPTNYIIQGDLFSTMFTLRIFFYLNNRERIPAIIYEESLKWVLNNTTSIHPIKDKILPIYLMALYDYKKYENYINEIFKKNNHEINEFVDLFISKIEENDKAYAINNIESILWIAYDILPVNNKIIGVSELLHKIINIVSSFMENNSFFDNSVSSNVIYFKTRFYSLVLSVFSDLYEGSFCNLITDELIKKISYTRIKKFISDNISNQAPFINAIRKWIKPKLNNIDSISGGFSGSEIVRISSKIDIPINNQEVPLPNLICKISETDNFEIELNNYKNVPNTLKKFFSKSSDTINYNNEKVFLIMEDLVDYYTLLEIINKESSTESFLKDLYHDLFHTLRFIYTYKSQTQNNKLIFSLYYDDIIRSIGVISKQQFENKFEIIKHLNEKLNKMFDPINTIKSIPCTNMHGDLNLRNIMIKSMKDDFSIRFIDLDNFSRSGDYIYDLGELYVDSMVTINNKSVLSELTIFISKLANELNDSDFEIRFNLSVYRSLLKLTKINFNRGNDDLALKFLQKSIEVNGLDNDE